MGLSNNGWGNSIHKNRLPRGMNFGNSGTDKFGDRQIRGQTLQTLAVFGAVF